MTEPLFARLPERFFSDGTPKAQGLYDPANEHDSCGVGFVAHIKGKKSRQIVDDSLRMLKHMAHRGACGCETNTGDGAGILTAITHDFFARIAASDLKFKLPEAGAYGVGLVFLPTDPAQRASAKSSVEKIIAQLK